MAVYSVCALLLSAAIYLCLPPVFSEQASRLASPHYCSSFSLHYAISKGVSFLPKERELFHYVFPMRCNSNYPNKSFFSSCTVETSACGNGKTYKSGRKRHAKRTSPLSLFARTFASEKRMTSASSFAPSPPFSAAFRYGVEGSFFPFLLYLYLCVRAHFILLLFAFYLSIAFYCPILFSRLSFPLSL